MNVDYNGRFYTAGNWSFDEADKDLDYIEDALDAWTAWREYVQADMLRGQL